MQTHAACMHMTVVCILYYRITTFPTAYENVLPSSTVCIYILFENSMQVICRIYIIATILLQLLFSVISNGFLYEGSIICPSCLQICYVSALSTLLVVNNKNTCVFFYIVCFYQSSYFPFAIGKEGIIGLEHHKIFEISCNQYYS